MVKRNFSYLGPIALKTLYLYLMGSLICIKHTILTGFTQMRIRYYQTWKTHWKWI